MTIIVSDKTIIIDGYGYLNMQQDLSWIPSEVHTLQWRNGRGEIEYIDTRPNEEITELGIYEQAIIDYNNEKARIQAELDEIENSRDYWKEFRDLRNRRLMESDWSQLPDISLSNTEKQKWATYRQQLRDLPQNITDPKPLVLDPNHPEWISAP
jgi:hypothetical protein